MSTPDIDVRKIASLARLEFSDSEVTALEKKFQELLSAFGSFEKIKTDGVEPLFHFSEQMMPREDIPKEPIDTKTLLSNAGDKVESCFRLPKVVGDAE